MTDSTSNSNDESPTIEELASNKRRPNGCFLGAITILVLFVGGIVLVPLLSGPRGCGDSLRPACSSQLRNIAIALMMYEAQYKQYPPLYTVDVTGNRLHSWRSLLLPYLEQQNLYNAIDFSKPWDHSANELARDQRISILVCPKADTPEKPLTSYVAVVAPHSLLQPERGSCSSDVRDGLSRTLCVVEVPSSHAVHWMSPYDIDLETLLRLLAEEKTSHSGGFNAAFCDGAVRFLPTKISPETLKALLTIDGEEIIPRDAFE